MDNLSVLKIALVAFTLLVSVSAETCSQMGSCATTYVSGIQTVGDTDISVICNLQADFEKCINSALADCESKGTTLPDAAVQSMRKSLNEAKKQYGQICQGAGGTGGGPQGAGGMGGGKGGEFNPEKATCFDVPKCAGDAAGQGGEIPEDLQKNCSYVDHMIKCMQSAFNDCVKNKLLTKPQKDEMSQQVKKIKELRAQFCKGNGGNVVSQTSLLFIFSSFVSVILAYNYKIV